MSLLKTSTMFLICSIALMGLNSCGVKSNQPWKDPLSSDAKGLSNSKIKKANLIAGISNPYQKGNAAALFLFKHKILVEGEGDKANGEGSLVFKLFEYLQDDELKREFIVTRNSLGNFQIEDLQDNTTVRAGTWGPRGKGVELITDSGSEKWELIPNSTNNLALDYLYYVGDAKTPKTAGVLNKKSELLPSLDNVFDKSCSNYVNKLGLKLFAEKTLVDAGGGAGLMSISDSAYSMLLESILEQRKDLPKSKPSNPSPYGDLLNLMKDFANGRMAQMSVSYSSGMFQTGPLMDKICKPSGNPKMAACKSYLSKLGIETTESLRVLRASLDKEMEVVTTQEDVASHIEKMKEMSEADQAALVEEVFQGLYDGHNVMVDSGCAYIVYRDTLSKFVKLDSEGATSFDLQGRLNFADEAEASCANKAKIAGRTAMRKKLIAANCITKLL